MKYTKEQINDSFNKLHESLQDFIMSEDVAEAVTIIVEEYEIPPVKSNDFALLVLGLLTTLVSIDEFLGELQHEYNQTEGKSQDILIDIDVMVLQPLLFLMAKIEEDKRIPTPTGPSTNLQSPGNSGGMAKVVSPSPEVEHKITLNIPTATTPIRPAYTAPAQTFNNGPIPLIPKKRPAPVENTHIYTRPTYTPPVPKLDPEHMLEDHEGNIDNVMPTIQPQTKPNHNFLDEKLTGQTAVPKEELFLSTGTKPPQPKKDGPDPYRENI